MIEGQSPKTMAAFCRKESGVCGEEFAGCGESFSIFGGIGEDCAVLCLIYRSEVKMV